MSAETPLQWPQGWPRTPADKVIGSKYRFARSGVGGAGGRQLWTIAAACQSLETELKRLGAEEVYVTSDFAVGKFGGFRDDRRPKDQGVAVYFQLKGRAMVMAQDLHARAEENLRALALAVEAMRTLERHGGGTMMDKAFTGFAALPPPPSPWQILGLGKNASREAVQVAYRQLAARYHPDKPDGDWIRMAEINLARDACLKLLEGK